MSSTSTFKDRTNIRQTNIKCLREIVKDFDDIAAKLVELANERDKCKKELNEICQIMIKTLYLQVNMKIERIKFNIGSIKRVDGGGILSTITNYSIKHNRLSMSNQIHKMSMTIKQTIPEIENREQQTAKERSLIALTLLEELHKFWFQILVPDLIQKNLLVKDAPLEKELKEEAEKLIEEIKQNIHDDERKFSRQMSSLHSPKS